MKAGGSRLPGSEHYTVRRRLLRWVGARASPDHLTSAPAPEHTPPRTGARSSPTPPLSLKYPSLSSVDRAAVRQLVIGGRRWRRIGALSPLPICRRSIALNASFI